MHTSLFAPSRPDREPFGVAYPGFQGPHPARSAKLTPRGVAHFQLKTGDLLQVDAEAARFTARVAVFDDHGGSAPQSLGLTATTEPLAPARYDHERLTGWRAARGDGRPDVDCVALDAADKLIVLRAVAPCDVWLIAPTEPDALIDGLSGGDATATHRPADTGAALLPPPLGAISDEFTVPRGSARAYPVRRGQVVQVIDIAGRQCSDFMALRADALDQGLERHIDNTVTRTMVGGAYPTPGLFDKFYDQDMRPLLALVQDTVGRHDTFALACTAKGYEDRGFPGHVNCSDNISDELERFDVARRGAWPAINFFFNSWIAPHDSRLRVDEAWSRPGDYVALRALDDLVCVSTACPDDIDPINGWDPTDVHVRIYNAEAPIVHAVAHRPKENAVPVLTEESAFGPRTRALTHRFTPARDVWLPTSYAGAGAHEEYWACREAATLQDTSSLRKYDIRGPEAQRLLQRAMTRNVERLSVHRGAYALICDASGAVIDDGTLFRLGPDLFRWCCGSEESGRWLAALAREDDLRVWIDDLHGAMPSLALQGPKSRDILSGLAYTRGAAPTVDALKWFGVTVCRLHGPDGAPFMLTRSGFTGELGYEIFCDKANALEIWDALMAAGAPHGLTPMGREAQETMRIEAGLMVAGAEFGGDVDPFEAGLGFAVDLRKTDFMGRAALERISGAPRRRLIGLRLAGDEIPHHADPVFDGERPVGVVTSATRSPELGAVIAMARVAVEYAEPGRSLAVGRLDGRSKRLAAETTSIPFIDPERAKPRA